MIYTVNNRNDWEKWYRWCRGIAGPHDQPLTNHALPQQLGRSINFCWKARTWASVHDRRLKMSMKRPSVCTASAWLPKHHNGFIWVSAIHGCEMLLDSRK
jgi:hypothetical protein